DAGGVAGGSRADDHDLVQGGGGGAGRRHVSPSSRWVYVSSAGVNAAGRRIVPGAVARAWSLDLDLGELDAVAAVGVGDRQGGEPQDQLIGLHRLAEREARLGAHLPGGQHVSLGGAGGPGGT